MDHAADALWRSGDKEKSKELWLRAKSASSLNWNCSGTAPEPVKKKTLAQLQAVSPAQRRRAPAGARHRTARRKESRFQARDRTPRREAG